MAEFIGGPIDEGVVNQLNVRSDVLSRTEGNEKFLKSRLFNSAWINVVSSANLIDGVDSEKGAELAKRYVLSGGSLTWNGTDFNIGGGIDFRGADSSKLYNYSEAKGVRPRPGITGFQIVSKNRFGAIREATINFNVWSQEDLVNIERLYFRPGFHAVVEWGHSEFVNNGSGLETGRTGVTSDFFNEVDTPSKIAGILKEVTDDRSYNYDSFIGVIKNFSYSFRQDGGYDCIISIISKGEILDSIRLASGDPGYPDGSDDDGLANVNIISYFVKILTKDKYGGDSGESRVFTKKKLVEVINTGVLLQEVREVSREVNALNLGFAGAADAASTGRITERLRERGTIEGKETAAIKRKAEILLEFVNQTFANDDDVVGISKDMDISGADYDYDIVYIPLHIVLELINYQVALTMPTKKVPRFDNRSVKALLSSIPKQILVDPGTCLLPERTTDGFVQVGDVLLHPLNNLSVNAAVNNLTSSYEAKDISNIFIASPLLFKLCRRYLGKDVPPDRSLAKDFIQDMMDEVGKALGDINDFDIEYSPDATQDIAYIVDRKVTPAPGTGALKDRARIPTLPLTGLRSFISQLSIQTKISNQLGSQIAIAAQGSATDEDYNAYVANYKEWNRNLYDRFDRPDVAPPSSVVGENDPRFVGPVRNVTIERVIDLQAKKDNLIEKLKELYTQFHKGTYDEDDWTSVVKHAQTLYKKEEEISDLVAGRPPKGLIPTELSFTMDGIGGLKIGQSFKVQEGILPFTYNRYGYIITGLEHSIQNGKWLTTVKAQTFILQFKN